MISGLTCTSSLSVRLAEDFSLKRSSWLVTKSVSDSDNCGPWGNISCIETLDPEKILHQENLRAFYWFKTIPWYLMIWDSQQRWGIGSRGREGLEIEDYRWSRMFLLLAPKYWSPHGLPGIGFDVETYWRQSNQFSIHLRTICRLTLPCGTLFCGWLDGVVGNYIHI